MRKDLEEFCENIDAAIFVGDSLEDETTRRELRAYLSRWNKELDLEDKLAENYMYE